jgi:lipoprotein-releasing system ATP-binding protein
MTREPILRATHLAKTYQRRDGVLPVLEDVSLEVRGAEIVAVLGASGAGKSTLLHLLGSLDEPSGGAVEIDGVNPAACRARELDRLRNRTLGFVFQFHYLLPEFDALENVAMPALIAGQDGARARSEARRLLEEVGLGERASHFPAELSGGEQQRVAVARALVNRPSIVLADEPSGNLDERNSDDLHRLIRTLCDRTGGAFVVVTHKKEFSLLADRVLLLEDGRLSEDGA